MPEEIARRVLQEVEALRPGTTMCPGMLAKRVGAKLAELRPVLQTLATKNQLCVRQKGRIADLAKLRGPFRVGPPR